MARPLCHSGYRLAQSAIGVVVRDEMEVAFRPSRRTIFDSLTRLDNDRAFGLRHLARAVSLRPQLVAFRDSLARSSPVAEVVGCAARFLPPGATSVGEPPLVEFALFRPDGYALPAGVVVDLLHAYESNVILFLAHEFHHTYLGRINTQPVAATNPADQMLRAALWALRNEAIADLIDKSFPFASPNPALAAYVRRYNAEYAQTPTTIHVLDSLLAGVLDDSTRMAAAGQRVRALLWSSGHANGAFIAREIYETFGVDSLLPAIGSPAAFLRTYGAAERIRGNASPFSSKAISTIELLERRYGVLKP